MEKESKLKQMEELDAKSEKINYDLAGLETRKKESKFNWILFLCLYRLMFFNQYLILHW